MMSLSTMLIMKKEEIERIRALIGWYCSKCGSRIEGKILEMHKDRYGKLPDCPTCGDTVWEYGIYPEYRR